MEEFGTHKSIEKESPPPRDRFVLREIVGGLFGLKIVYEGDEEEDSLFERQYLLDRTGFEKTVEWLTKCCRSTGRNADIRLYVYEDAVERELHAALAERGGATLSKKVFYEGEYYANDGVSDVIAAELTYDDMEKAVRRRMREEVEE